MGLADRIKRTADRLSHTSVRGSSEAKIVGGKVYGGAKAVYSGAKTAKNKVNDIQADHREKKGN